MNPAEFHFDGYRVRPIEEKDRAYLEQLIEADPFHRGKMTADFFLRKQMGHDAWALENEAGQIVFYFATRTAVRMFIQFPPVTSFTDRLRNRSALFRGFLWIKSRLAANGFHELICDTEGPDLKKFLTRILGFTEASTLSFWLRSPIEAPPTPPASFASLANEESGKEVSANVRP